MLKKVKIGIFLSVMLLIKQLFDTFNM